MVSGAKKCSCTELTGKILSWPNVIQIFIRLDNLVKNIQMEEGKSMLFFLFLSNLQMTRTVKNGGRVISNPYPPPASHHEWAPWRVSWPFSAHHKLQEIVEHLGSRPDTRHWIVSAILVKNKTLRCRRCDFPRARPIARWHGRVAEGMNWGSKSRKGNEMCWVWFPFMTLFNQLHTD